MLKCKYVNIHIYVCMYVYTHTYSTLAHFLISQLRLFGDQAFGDNDVFVKAPLGWTLLETSAFTLIVCVEAYLDDLIS